MVGSCHVTLFIPQLHDNCDEEISSCHTVGSSELPWAEAGMQMNLTSFNPHKNMP